VSFFKNLKNIFFPLDPSLEKAYWNHQLAVISKPLQFAAVFGSFILWISVALGSSVINLNSFRYWFAAAIQLWLIVMFFTLNSVGRSRYVAVFTTPFFPAVVTYFLAIYIIPSLRFQEEMIHAYPIIIILVISFYAFDTLSTGLAIISGVTTSLVLYFARKKNPHIPTDEHVFFLAHIVLANLVGLVMNIHGCYTSRMQFKLARIAEKDREVLDSLIKRVFPESIGKELKTKGANLARGYKNVTLVLADIANFTQITTTLEPKQLVTLLHELFHRFDRLADKHGVEKIKTIGDAYMAAAGCPVQIKNHTQRVAFFSLELLKLLQSFNKQFQTDFKIRIGIHTGSVVGGVISGKRISFDIWGETVNLTSRLQNIAEPGEIIVSDEATKLLRSDFVVSEFRMVDLKGLGPTPVARLISSHEKNPFLSGGSKPDSQLLVSELPFLSQH
jgi:class 3 adenylate cyclase